MNMLNFLVRCATVVLALSIPVTTKAVILYESATNGGPSNGGILVASFQMVASEFTLHSPILLTNITGEIQSLPGTPNLLFMTLLQLSGPGLPNNVEGDPFAGTSQIYTTTFNAAPGYTDQEVSFPVSLSVPAGTYAVLFGSGLFGSPSTAGGFMPGIGSGNVVLPGANLFTWYDSDGNGQGQWVASANGGERFVIQGIPEPSSTILLLLGAAGLAIYRKANSLHPQHDILD